MVSRLKAFLVVISLIIGVFSNEYIVSANFESSAEAAVLMEASTGRILYKKNSKEKMPPASITKIMTLLIGFEALRDGKVSWDDKVPISEKAWKMEGSRMFLEVGKTVSYKELLTGIAVVSANDGCVALAEFLYGSERAFVDIMNNKARKIGLTSTHFANCTGLPDKNHYMTATDIAILARYVVTKYPEVLNFESQKEFTYNNIHQYNRNPLLGFFPGADGLKTGWTTKAGYCLVGTAKQKDIRFIAVVLNTKSEKERLDASRELLNYGFRNFGFVRVLDKGLINETIEIKKGKKTKAPLKLDDTITVLMRISDKNKIKTIVEKDFKKLTAPVSKGTVVGRLKVMIDKEVLADGSVSVAEDIPKANFFELLFRSIKNIIRSLFGS